MTYGKKEYKEVELFENNIPTSETVTSAKQITIASDTNNMCTQASNW